MGCPRCEKPDADSLLMGQCQKLAEYRRGVVEDIHADADRKTGQSPETGLLGFLTMTND